MAPTSSTETMKHITLHHFLKQQRLKPTVMWTWQAAEATGRAASDEAAADDVDGAMGGTWPPRSYTCAFCRREFRSAQALGGHMNVHRRDRAKMRGQYGAAAQLGLGGAAAQSGAEAPAPTEYAVLYPVLNSNAAGTTRAVFMPSGDVLLSAPMALAAAAAARGHQCHGNVDENDKEIDLELRLGWR